jgi:hypothetical protein
MSKRDDFINTALSHKGESSAARNWVKKMTGYPADTSAWCAAFVYACCKSVGGLYGKVMGANSWGGAGSWFKYGTEKKLGTWHRAGWHGVSYTPAPGDLISFRWKARGTSGASKYNYEYFSDHIGIVAYVSGDTITTIEGNKSNACGSRTLKPSTTSVNGYYHPNWTLIGIPDDGSAASGGGTFEPLYNTYNTAEDADMREVGYISGKGSVTLSSTDIAVSAINYTVGLASLFNYFGSKGLTTQYKIDVSNIRDQNARVIAKYLLDKGLNIANVVGILGCIQARSSFTTNKASNSGSELGILQWSGERRKRLLDKVPNWPTNLTGQCDFLWEDMCSKHKNLIDSLYLVTDISIQGAIASAELFFKNYEQLNGLEDAMKIRSINIRDMWPQIVIIPIASGSYSSTSSNMSIVTQSGKVLTSAKKKVVVPDDAYDYGIDETYESYGWVGSVMMRQNKGFAGRKVAEEWVKLGKQGERNIAKIKGYYLIAMTTTFANIGEIVTVVLKDGTSFNAILADSKGKGNGSSTNKWGHYHPKKPYVNMVEWNKWSPDFDGVQTNNRKLDLTGLKGKKIDYVINWGTYFT